MGNQKDKKQGEGIGGAIFLIGVGILFLSEVPFFPWILLVIGLSSVVESIPQEGFWAGIQGLLWMGGLAILFATGLFWPGILILIGLSTLAGALVRPPVFDKQKRKRGLPPELASNYDEGDDAIYASEYDEEDGYAYADAD